MRKLIIICCIIIFNFKSFGQVNYYYYFDMESKIGVFMSIDMKDDTKSLLKFYDIKNSIESYKADFKRQELLKAYNSTNGSLLDTKSIICYHTFYGEFGSKKAVLFFDYQIQNNKVKLQFDSENSEYYLKIPSSLVLEKY